MKAFRGPRILALALAGALALLGAVAGAAAPASATAGLIDGYVFELDGTTPIAGAKVLFDDGSIPPAYVTTTTDAGGYYFFTPPPLWDDEDFGIVVNGGTDHLDAFDIGHYVSADPNSGVMADTVLGPGRRITGIIRDAATGAPLDDVVVVAGGTLSSRSYEALPPTDSSGVYSVAVTPGDDYLVFALEGSGDFDPQLYDHIDASALSAGCGCSTGDLVTVPSGTGPAVTGIDFDLRAYADWVYFSVYADDLNGTEKPGVLVHLDKWDGAAWTPDVDTDLTDGDGYADIFGLGDGDYRLRYSVGGVDVVIDSWYEPGFTSWPLSDGGKAVEMPGLVTSACGCGGFTTLLIDLTFPLPSGSGGSGGGAGGPSRPASSGPTTFTLPTQPTATPTPTPTPTPTSSPTPSSSPSSSPSVAATPDPIPVRDAAFPWWIILIIVLAVGIVIVVVVLIRRR